MQVDTERFINEIKLSVVERIDTLEQSLDRIVTILSADLRREIDKQQKVIDEIQSSFSLCTEKHQELSTDESDLVNAKFSSLQKSLTAIKERMTTMVSRENHTQFDSVLQGRLNKLQEDVQGLREYRSRQEGRYAVLIVVISTMISLGFILLNHWLKV